MARPGFLRTLFGNIRHTLSIRKQIGKIIGRDKFGNTYFELPADPLKNDKNPRRWLEVEDKDNYLPEVPVEWEAWIRNKRADPPSHEELQRNQSLIDLKKKNAKEIDDKFNAENNKKIVVLPEDPQKEKKFPSYAEYESMPGTRKNS